MTQKSSTRVAQTDDGYAGEPIVEDDDFFGTHGDSKNRRPDSRFDRNDDRAVQLAARVCDRAEPGQVLVSDVIRQLCAGKQLTFIHHSDATLKGFDEPVALFVVGPSA